MPLVLLPPPTGSIHIWAKQLLWPWHSKVSLCPVEHSSLCFCEPWWYLPLWDPPKRLKRTLFLSGKDAGSSWSLRAINKAWKLNHSKRSLVSRGFWHWGGINAAQKSCCALCRSCNRKIGRVKASQNCLLSLREEQKDKETKSPFFSSCHSFDSSGKQLQWRNCCWVLFMIRFIRSDSVLIVSHTRKAYYLWSFYLAHVNVRPASSEASQAWSNRRVLHRPDFHQQPSCPSVATLS